MVLSKKIKTLSAGFFKNPPDGRGHGLKCIESKNGRHFDKPTFWVLQLWISYSRWFMHFKCLKNAPCLSFGRFSSNMKRCRHTRMQRFTRELKRPNQRQGPFLGHLKCSNHPGTKVQSCRYQKVGFTKWRRFFDLTQLAMLSALWWVLYVGRNFYSKTDLKGKISFGL